MNKYRVRVVRTAPGGSTNVSYKHVTASSSWDAEKKAIAESERHQPGGPSAGYTYTASAEEQ